MVQIAGLCFSGYCRARFWAFQSLPIYRGNQALLISTHKVRFRGTQIWPVQTSTEPEHVDEQTTPPPPIPTLACVNVTKINIRELACLIAQFGIISLLNEDYLITCLCSDVFVAQFNVFFHLSSFFCVPSLSPGCCLVLLGGGVDQLLSLSVSISCVPDPPSSPGAVQDHHACCL